MAATYTGTVKAASTAVTVGVLLRKTVDGTEQTALAYNTAGLVASYQREGAVRVAITLATQTVTGAWSSGGLVEIDATNMPGVYRLDVPDAAFVSGADWVIVAVKYTGCYVYYERFDLTAAVAGDPVASVTGAVASVTGNVGGNVVGSVASVTGAVTLVAGQKVDVDTIKTQTLTCAAPVTVLASLGTAATSTAQTGDSFALANGTSGFVATKTDTAAVKVKTDFLPSAAAGGASGLAIVGSVMGKSAATLAPADVSGNLPVDVKAITTGVDFNAAMKTSLNAATPASITGAVASVTADVGITQAGADKVWSTTARALTDKVGFALSTAGIKAIWDQLTSALTTVGSIGKKLTDWVLGSDSKVLLSGDAQSGVTIPTVTNLTNAPTAGDLTATMKTSVTAAVPSATDNADALLKRDWASVSGEAARSVLNALRFLRNKWSLSINTLTVTKEDDTTTAWTGTTTTDSNALPIVSNDPS